MARSFHLMPKKFELDPDVMERLRQMADGEEIIEHDPRHDTEYRPPLGPKQVEVYDSFATYLLASGERGTGKSWVAGGDKLVRHLWRNWNALAVIVVGVKAQATMGGIWYKLQTNILPRWAEHQGLTYSDIKYDEQKNPYIDVSNKHGGMSRVVLISAPHGKVLKNRIKGYEASYIFVEEITTLDGPIYFNAIVQQVGRRKGIQDPQQYVAACNPDGPSHWVYNRWFVLPVDPDTGLHNPAYCHIHIPYADNIDPEPGYLSIVEEAVRGDPIEADRMLRGLWIDRPSGAAIFKDYFLEPLHIRPYPIDPKTRILPNPNYPVIVGYDLGSANNAIIFLQWMPMLFKDGDKDVIRNMWIQFDEMIYTNRRLDFKILVPALMRRMARWNSVMQEKHSNPSLKLEWEHISDNSAFNQFRQARGSYDVMDFERESKKHAELYKLGPIKMREAPKFPGSKEARIRLMMNLLQREEFILSSSCKKSKAMFMNLESEKPEAGVYDPGLAFEPRRSIYLHPFDALTYPIITYDIKRSPARAIATGNSQSVGRMGA